MLIREELYHRDRSKANKKKELVPLIDTRKIYEGINILKKGDGFRAVIKEEYSSANYGSGANNMNSQTISKNNYHYQAHPNSQSGNNKMGTKNNFNQNNMQKDYYSNPRHERKYSHDEGNKLFRSISPVKLGDKSHSPVREKFNAFNGLNSTKSKLLPQGDSSRLSNLGNSTSPFKPVSQYNHIAEAYNTKSKMNMGVKINTPGKGLINMNNFFNKEGNDDKKYLPDVNSNLKLINKPKSENDSHIMSEKLNRLDLLNRLSIVENGNSLPRQINQAINKDKERERELTPNNSRKFLLMKENSERSILANNIGRKYSKNGISASPKNSSRDAGIIMIPQPDLTDLKKSSAIISKYASKTKPGMTFDGNFKTNQDSFLIKTKIFNLDNYAVFGVFDGHGMHGHFVSNMIKLFLADYYSRVDLFLTKDKLMQINNGMSSTKKLNSNVKSQVNLNNTGLKEEDIYDKLKEKNYHIIKSSFFLAETALSQSKYEVNFSGATCVVVIIVHNKIICANAGDSRAILVTEGADSMEETIIPLSRDHKPEIKEEMQRIVKNGGRVERYNDNGIKSGPFRVWLKNENFPGLAMSRSVGDFVAESVGVTCEPEIFEYTLPGSGSKFMVIASDGVWEFLTNEQITEIVNWYYKSNDPNGAAEKIVEEAVKKWKQEDDVIDDITAVVVFFNKNI